MCMFDGADYLSTFWTQRTVTARKPHVCSECGRRIDKGERHRTVFSVEEGSAYSYRHCAHCIVLMNWLVQECDGYIYEGVIEDFEEHANGRIDLLRCVVGAHRKWKRFDGKGLMALPRMPYTSEALATRELGERVKYSYRTEKYEVDLR